MATADDLIDRVDREWLAPPTSQPVTFSSAGTVLPSASSFDPNKDLLTVEEEVLFAPGAVIEDIETYELMYVTSYNGTTLTVDRGVLGTAAADITIGDQFRVNPAFPRQTIFNTLADVIEDCSPPLWIEKNTTTTIPSSGYVEAPSDFQGLVSAQYQANNRWYAPQIEAHKHFPASSTGKALFIGGTPGKTCYLSYKGDVDRPTSKTDLLPNDSWQRLYMVGTVAQLVGAVDINQLTAEFLTAKLEMENVPVGTGVQLRSALMRYYDYLLGQAKMQLQRNMGGMRVTVNGKYV